MHRLLLPLLTVISLLSQAQEIKGFAKDDAGTPLKGATASLLQAADSAIVKLALSDKDGGYSFAAIPHGSYRVMITHVGYRPSFSPVISLQSAEVRVPEQKLEKLSGEMNAVTVSATKPLVELRADKMVLNVEGTINATGSNALELLRRSPGVLLDKDERISLAGKNGVQVYIDGRSTPLSGDELANYLKSLPSSQVEAIELITNPSAKYEAAGNAGIINIRLVKNKALGTNGTVNAGWNMGNTAKYNTGASLNHRNKSINIFTTYAFSQGSTAQEISFLRTITDSLFDQQGTITDTRHAHNIKLDADYSLNRKSTLGLLVNGVFSDPRSVAANQTGIFHAAENQPNRLLRSSNTTVMKRHSSNVNLNYNFGDGKGKTFSFNADRGAFDFNSNQVQGNQYFNPTSGNSLGSVNYHIISPAQINIKSLKSDYEQNLGKGKLSLGAKIAWVKTDNDFQRYNITGNVEEPDRERSNHFVYQEKISAGYISYNRQFKGFMIQAGLRAEHTATEGLSKGLKFNGNSFEMNTSAFNRDYTDLFPNAVITFNKNPMKQWSLSYSRRIDRPAYQDLNPFEFKLDEYTFMKGNINLRPQYTNSFGLVHSYKYKLNISLNYSHVNDLFTQIFDTLETSKAFVSKRNLATQDILSFNLSYPFQYKAYSLFANVSSNYARYKADFGTGRKVDLQAVGFNLFMQNTLKLSKTCTAELSGFYNAPTVYMGSFKGRSIYSMDIGLSRQMMAGKMNVKALVSDVFHSQCMNFTSDFAGQVMKMHVLPESRQFKLNISYRFGSATVKAARQRTTGAEEELKRVQQGGGLMGNN